MKRQYVLKLVFVLLCIAEIAFLAIAVSVNGPSNSSVNSALARWSKNPSEENRRAFEAEVTNSERGPRLIRRVCLLTAVGDAALLWVLYRKVEWRKTDE